MRIISGSHKGKIIRAPKNFKLRPTTDIAKESLFNILNNWYDFQDLHVLDLFAGIGSISLEFASRGAKSIQAVEIHSKHSSFIERTAEDLSFHNLKVLRADALNYINKTAQQFDIIFADPPYTFDQYPLIPESVFANNLLTENGTLIIEHSKANSLSNIARFHEQRNYGKVCFSFFE